MCVRVCVCCNQNYLRTVLLVHHVLPAIAIRVLVFAIIKMILVDLIVFANVGFYFEHVVSVSFK
jgi:hypothetical protein